MEKTTLDKPNEDLQKSADLTGPTGVSRTPDLGSPEALRSFFKQALADTFHEVRPQAGLSARPSEPSGPLLDSVRRVVEIVRALDCDPHKLAILPPKGLTGLSYWERVRAQRAFSCWASLVGLLRSSQLRGGDWMVVFKSLANAVEGQEREHGMVLVRQALLRPDMSVQAIGAFAKLFRAARGAGPEDTALTMLAIGDATHALCWHEREVGQAGAAVERGVQIVRALQAVKVKQTGSLLLVHAAMADYYQKSPSAEHTVFKIFAATHGVPNIMNAQFTNGTSTLMWAANNTVVDGPHSVVAHLLALGFDANMTNAEGKNALTSALHTRGKTLQLLQEFDRQGAISEADMTGLTENPGAIQDPEARAFIAARQTGLAVDALLASGRASGPVL